MSAPDERNAAQRAFWDGAGGAAWLERSAEIDAHLAPAQEAALAVAAPTEGERVVDIGCGAGASARALADRVGPRGHVLALDLSHAMIDRARRRDARANLAWAAVDAAAHDFQPAAFDLLFSRFGVMFFGDPVAAFANLKRALRSDGRMAFACWRPVEENPWMRAPLRAVCKHVPRPPRPGPDDPGPFAFADPERVGGILARAGFAAPRFDKVDFEIDLALGRGLDAAVASASSSGAAAAALKDQPEDLRQAALEELRKELSRYERAGRVPLPAAIWVVATRPNGR